MAARLMLGLLCVAMSVGGCSSAREAAGDPSGDWMLVSLNGDAVAGPQALTLTWDAAERRIGGNAGCNRYSAAWTGEDGAIDIGPVAATKRACIDAGIGAQERRFLGVLDAVERYRVDRYGRLVLDGPDGAILVFEPAKQEG